jgi:serine/threonine protein kinase
MDELIGRTFGAYQLVDLLGQGGMAVVYRGFQPSLNRYVAIKVLRGELARDPEFVTRFQREALAAAKLSHPNIVHVYDAGLADGIYYIAMDYVDGGSLRDLLDQGPLPTERAIGIAIQMANALDYAHQQSLIHRDVKPNNVLMTRDGRPLLTDFGIAKLLDSAGLTRTGTAIGTPEYMAPEQVQAQVTDARTDIYALGIVLYEMLTGQVPFRGQTPMVTLYKQVNEAAPPLRQLNIGVPEWLETVVGKAMAKRPGDRYQRASDLVQALRRPPAPSRPQTPQPARAQTPPPPEPRGRYQTPQPGPYQTPQPGPYQAPPPRQYQAPPPRQYQAPPAGPYQAPPGRQYQPRPAAPPRRKRGRSAIVLVLLLLCVVCCVCVILSVLSNPDLGNVFSSMVGTLDAMTPVP